MSVVEIKGKQYLVEGDKLLVPHLELNPGEKLVVKDLLTGKDITFEVVEHKRGDKIRVSKFRNKTRYLRIIGHRSLQTIVKLATEKEEKKVKEVKSEEPKAKKKPVQKKDKNEG